MNIPGRNIKTGILGCGWLGLPLAEKLIYSGATVTGTTTSPEKLLILEQASVKPVLYNALYDPFPASLLTTDVLIFAFPPKTKTTNGEWYYTVVKKICGIITKSNIKKVIMLSSTSVYPETAEPVDENYPISYQNTGNVFQFKAEQLVSCLNIPGYIIRLGGLAGYNRLLARHFSGKNNLSNARHPVNLLHQDDAIAILELFVFNNFQPGFYNACSPVHPVKSEFYIKECKRHNLPLPEFNNKKKDKGKVISVEKLLKNTAYQFKFPDPEQYTYNQCN